MIDWPATRALRNLGSSALNAGLPYGAWPARFCAQLPSADRLAGRILKIWNLHPNRTQKPINVIRAE
jgi:hypothetical protein